MATALDLITAALQENNIVAPGEPLSAEESKFGLDKLNDILDEWSARKIMCYNVNFSTFTLTPNKQPHTIGPTGDFQTTMRPVRIEACAIVIQNGGQPVTMPIPVRDDDWWAAQRVKQISAQVPTDVYYSPDIPNGSLYFWPIPNIAYGVELETAVILNQVSALATPLTLPPAYRRAMKLTLAEELAEPFGKTPGQMLVRNAMRARAVISGVNSKSPRIDLSSGMSKSNKSTENYLTGWMR